jgi:peroxiredoxin
MTTRARACATLLVAALLGVGGGYFAYRHLAPAPAVISAPMTAATIAAPSALPVFSLNDLEGRRRDSREWSGKVMVINFWATWCNPCRTEIPHLITTQDAHGGRGLQIVGVAIDTVDAVRDFSAELGINYPLLVGEDDAIALGSQLGNDLGALPYTVVADRAGAIVYVKRGAVDSAELERLITPLL